MLYSAGSNGKSNRLCGVPHRDGMDSARVLQEHRFQTRAERTSWPKSVNSVRSAWDEAQTSSRNFMTCSGLRHARTRAHRLVLGRQKASTPEYLQALVKDILGESSPGYPLLRASPGCAPPRCVS